MFSGFKAYTLGSIWMVMAGGCQGSLTLEEELQAQRRCFQEAVTWLADDAREGRGLGTDGLRQAEEWLAQRFTQMGLEAPKEGMLQPVPVVRSVTLDEGNTLQGPGPAAVIGVDFMPFGFSQIGSFEGPLVFAGYGLTVPRLNYDDYAGLDVKGAVVLAFRHEPEHRQKESRFDGRKAIPESNLIQRARRARELGARALIFVDAPRNKQFASNVPGLRNGGDLRDVGIPVLQVSRNQASRWLAGTGVSLKEVYTAIEADTQPHSTAVPGVEIRGEIRLNRESYTPHNVVGVWPGEGALAEEAIVIGAHLDHIGFGGLDSLEPATTAVHPGADDNASGVAAMVCALEAARQQSRTKSRRTVVAVGFTAEEIGLWGSKAYVNQPVMPLEQTKAMVNLDMVGRTGIHPLLVLGAYEGSGWTDYVKPIGDRLGLAIEFKADDGGRSDHASFQDVEIPAIHLHSGIHRAYHTTFDTVNGVSWQGGAQVTVLLKAVADSLISEPVLGLNSSSKWQIVGDVHYAPRGFLGFQIKEQEIGRQAVVRIESVKQDSMAQELGFESGLGILEINYARIQTRADYFYVLSHARMGDFICIQTDGHPDAARRCGPLGRH